MTKDDAIAWVADHDDDDVFDDAELEEAFVALYNRPADDDDREVGLWTLCCVAVDADAEGAPQTDEPEVSPE